MVCENHLVGSELLSKRAHAQPPVEYPSGNPLDAKFLVEPIRSSGSTDDALEEAGQAEQHIVTDAAPNSSNLVRVRKVMRVGHRQVRGVWGVRQTSVARITS